VEDPLPGAGIGRPHSRWPAPGLRDSPPSPRPTVSSSGLPAECARVVGGRFGVAGGGAAPEGAPPPWVHPGVVSGRSRVPRFGCVCRACAAAAAEAGGYEADVKTHGRYLNSWWVTHICMSYPVCARSYGGHASLADPRGTCTAGTCRHGTWRPGPRGPRVVSRPAHRQIRLSVQISAIP
jgi:hypothetical protein